MYNKYVRGGLGRHVLADLKYSTIIDLYKELIFKNGFKPNSMEIIHTIMGHSDFSTTMDIYHTVTEELKMESFEGLDKKLFQ